MLGYRISSEDSGETPFYMEDSDDSCELDHEAGQTGQMNLLEEILDSLSTTTLDHGSRLSSAKSLDFFRSMDEIDCSTTVRQACFGVLGILSCVSLMSYLAFFLPSEQMHIYKKFNIDKLYGISICFRICL